MRQLYLMIKAVLFLLTLMMSFTSFSQKEPLHYFYNSDSSRLGMRNAAGKIVIPGVYPATVQWNGAAFTGNVILLSDSAKPAIDSMHFSYHLAALDRSGKLLFHPYWFDNGPDEYREGLIRFVELGKMGFADYNGKIVIPAKYNIVDPFYRGYAVACLDCRYTRHSDDEEHCCGYIGNKYALIDRSGNTVHTPDEAPGSEMDSLLSVLKLIRPNTPQEEKIVHTLEQLTEVKHLSKENDGNICAVVAERPADKNGYYLIVFRIRDIYSYGDLSFLVKPDGKTILHLDSYGNIETLSEWRKKQ